MTNAFLSSDIEQFIERRPRHGCMLWRGSIKGRYGDEPIYHYRNPFTNRNSTVRVRQWLYQGWLHANGKPYPQGQVWRFTTSCRMGDRCVNPAHLVITERYPSWNDFVEDNRYAA